MGSTYRVSGRPLSKSLSVSTLCMDLQERQRQEPLFNNSLLGVSSPSASTVTNMSNTQTPQPHPSIPDSSKFGFDFEDAADPGTGLFEEADAGVLVRAQIRQEQWLRCLLARVKKNCTRSNGRKGVESGQNVQAKSVSPFCKTWYSPTYCTS